jgi:hypothetical protein
MPDPAQYRRIADHHIERLIHKYNPASWLRTLSGPDENLLVKRTIAEGRREDYPPPSQLWSIFFKASWYSLPAANSRSRAIVVFASSAIFGAVFSIAAAGMS